MEFGLSQPSDVTLRVYNVAGRLVRELMNGQLPGGVRIVRWDSRDSKESQVSSGIYFYELRAGSFSSRRRMVLLR
ncbi:MAG: T9SS type A sorting domain-containing protein [Candidatus Eisenbacteria bacterium]|uniref:T9SS type A sorting domain-containing protein n=1 Tax=Eiseniibacteriota bacterium TaxID=2212470 RepID=A0A538TRZ5_UNCEI|nr:MAG: T9SS type A sorting domain-containing protein [Candidatus Eisenbacteria bacterium]